MTKRSASCSHLGCGELLLLGGRLRLERLLPLSQPRVQIPQLRHLCLLLLHHSVCKAHCSSRKVPKVRYACEVSLFDIVMPASLLALQATPPSDADQSLATSHRRAACQGQPGGPAGLSEAGTSAQADLHALV